MKYYEDFEVGATKEVGSFELGREEIMEFAEKFDPLWLHTDEETARAESPFGGIIASGWHTLAASHGELVRSEEERIAALGSPGVGGVSWNQPVYPDEHLTVKRTIADKRSSEKMSNRGHVTLEVETTNTDGQTVLTYDPRMYVLQREAAGD